jgi:regulator of sigma E protease
MPNPGLHAVQQNRKSAGNHMRFDLHTEPICVIKVEFLENQMGLALALFSVLVALLALNAVVFVHELGHWLLAKAFGMRTPVFSIGFGSRKYSLVLGTYWGTEFRISPIPLGGYVQIEGLGETVDDDGAPVRRFAIWKRASVLSAGVIFNALFAVLIVFSVTMWRGHETDHLQATVTELSSPAPNTDLRVGDTITKINSKDILSVDYLQHFKQGTKLTLHVVRGSTELDVKLAVGKQGDFGVKRAWIQHVWERLGTLDAAKDAAVATYTELSTSAIAISKIVSSHHAPAPANPDAQSDNHDAPGAKSASRTKDGAHTAPAPAPKQAQAPSWSDLHGFIGIIYAGASLTKFGMIGVLLFMFKITCALAIMNVLPLPLLDGGQLTFLAFEKVRGRPLSETAQERISNGSLAFLLALMLWTVRNDVLSLWVDGLKITAIGVVVGVVFALGYTLWSMLTPEFKRKLGFRRRLTETQS